MKNYLPLIIGMTLVTYLPRLIPLRLLSNKKMNNKFQAFLSYIPYTSLSILIVRGIITADPAMKLAAIIGIGASALVSYIKGNLILSILAGILVSFIVINTPIWY